jgi:surfactin synthase thioesterase subunit
LSEANVTIRADQPTADVTPERPGREPFVPRGQTRGSRSPWLVHGPPGEGDFVIFGFHYPGVGTVSSYREWPRQIGTGVFCPLQPPGREDRFREPPVRSHRAYAESLAPDLAPHLARPYAFIGHCGAFPFMLETAFMLSELGLPTPRRLFASSWGAPQRGLYGPLSFVDLDEHDWVGEIQNMSRTRFGAELPEDLADVAAEALELDMRVQRTFRYSGQPPVPCPAVVIGWSADAIVPSEVVWPGWEECADASFVLLEGDHWEFLRCPSALLELIATEMSRAGQPDRS